MSEVWERFQNVNQFRFGKDLLQCSTCEQLLTAPIYLTESAGNICKACKTTNDIQAFRNEPLEVALAKVKKQDAAFPCKYVAKGCDQLLKQSDLLVHHLLCFYAPIKCPVCKCENFNSQNDCKDHCEDDHNLMTWKTDLIINLDEYDSDDGIKITLTKINYSCNEFYTKITQTRCDMIEIIICFPNGMKMNQELFISIKHKDDGAKQYQEIKTKAKIVECWNMMNSTDINHVNKIYLTELQKTNDCTNALSLQLIFNNNETPIVIKDSENFRKDIECPICFHYLSANIFKCPRGHVVCESCKNHITTCPICRDPMGDVHDTRLENVLPQFVMFCENQKHGCLFESGLKDLREHELNCMYHQFTCHIDGCNYESTQLLLIEHIQKDHKKYVYGSIVTVLVNQLFEVSFVYNNHIFFLESLLKDNNYVWRVSLVNNTAPAWEYVYTIHLFDENDSEVLMINNTCGNELCIDNQLVQSVCNKSGSIKIKCTVRKLANEF